MLTLLLVALPVLVVLVGLRASFVLARMNAEIELACRRSREQRLAGSVAELHLELERSA